MNEQLERIREMEAIRIECRDAVRETDRMMDRLEELRERMVRLMDYYGSDGWFDDQEAELPDGLYAGILSEDAGYDLVTGLRELAFRMLEQGTDILKNRI